MWLASTESPLRDRFQKTGPELVKLVEVPCTILRTMELRHDLLAPLQAI
jgi:hypothetical protein